ncbi:MAG: hypothetical protein CVU46_00330 [Chloroflexi bacterium HGW-Chloroflexi-8]|nr:MAG: hypothetical protein CVU46_00330 [Chloroflexi bacterium HGW-Chloroflexi-8]
MTDRNINPIKFKFLSDFVLQVRLVLRLIKDKRINPFLKIIPFAGLVYFIFPDILIGPIDDAALILGGSYLFLELCPAEIVAEHMQQLRLEGSKKKDKTSEEENIIDAEFHDVDRS